MAKLEGDVMFGYVGGDSTGSCLLLPTAAFAVSTWLNVLWLWTT